MKKQILFIAATFLILSNVLGQSKIDAQFFDTVDRFLGQNVKNGLVTYNGLANNTELQGLLNTVSQADLSQADAKTKQAFYINAYNLNVINEAAQRYPLESVQGVAGFFDRLKITVAGEKMTLNQLEKDKLLKVYGDPRYHFVLVCGALGCPPIIESAYRPESLEQQLEKQTRLAMNDPSFIRTNTASGKVEISQIFQWYQSDFGGSTAKVVAYINGYRSQPIDNKVGYYNYDWSLNNQSGSSSSTDAGPGLGNNASRYVVSAAIPKGGVEIKLFNNLYTQRTGNAETLTDRSTFLTTSLSFLYGLNSRFNIGFDARYRQVRNGLATDSPLAVFNPENSTSARTGITAIGPKVRIAPFPALENFSIQSSFVFATGSDLAGSEDRPYIDWNGATWWTQFFNDFSIGNNFSIFTEVDFLWEDIGNGDNGNINRVSTPATLIFSYFPNPKTTFYTLGGFSPYWQSEFDYFAQAGLGAKYQFTPNFELELLYTAFTNQFLQSINGRAATYNLGIRYNL